MSIAGTDIFVFGTYSEKCLFILFSDNCVYILYRVRFVFVVRNSINSVFVPDAGLSLLLVLSVATWQIRKTALRNPVEVLKSR